MQVSQFSRVNTIVTQQGQEQQSIQLENKQTDNQASKEKFQQLSFKALIKYRGKITFLISSVNNKHICHKFYKSSMRISPSNVQM